MIVVRDSAQLRSPQAAFNPKKRNSADLLAGTVPFSMLGGWGALNER